ncbi:hypothetical protein A1351_14060 [Methylosinus sp. R-45379]|uniref:phage portal protein n=1 Tax=Methylosinus sp. R-45379 TaxID=980563 RepID=UPI0007C89A5A|nr:phage portal protein [Methylosinus sp. R-45379]OAI26963.1 hypothetical protein A1351_14060 [Methylosinus sp. R-45379]
MSRRRRNFKRFHSPVVEEKALTLETFPTELLFAPTLSGPSVGPHNAFSVPAVASAIQLISSAIGTLPFSLFRHTDAGGKEPATDHPAFDLVADSPNDWTASSDLRAQLAQDAMLHGNAFAYTNKIDGRVVEIIRPVPGSVTMLINYATGEPSYRINPVAGQGNLDGSAEAVGDAGEPRVLPYDEVIHVRSPLSLNGDTGIAPIQHGREAIALALTLEQHAARLFANGARPASALELPAKLNDAAVARIGASINSAHSGMNSGRTMILESGAKFVQLALSSVDAQFAELRLQQLHEIARIFRVPPQMLAEYGRATFANSEEMARQFLTFCLLPWLRKFETAYRRVLLSPEERRTYSIEFDTSDLLRGDVNARGEFISKLRAGGVITANEARHMEQLPRHADGDKLENPYTTSAKGPANNAPANAS